jgi:aminoglycoside 6-adenylyltransferase
MIEWHTHTTHGWDHDIWHSGRFLEKWADPRIVGELRQVFARYNEAEIKQALWATLDLFRWVALETAANLEFSYPIEGDKQINQWLAVHLCDERIDHESAATHLG